MSRRSKAGVSETVWSIVVLIAICGISFGVVGVKSYFEMKTFNKFSESKATYMDALCSELRIEANRAN